MTQLTDSWLPTKTTGTHVSACPAEAQAFLRNQKYAICHSRRMMDVYEKAVMYAKGNRPIMILGPTGAGKEVIVQMIHALGDRSDAPLLDLNCGSFSESLIESQLFGHVKGSFTGATMDKRGFFEDVGRGCLFLDEIGELPLALQPRLLRVLEACTFRPLGSTGQRSFQGRIIAATNRNVHEMVSNGLFRDDLLHRLNTFTIEVPSLKRHIEDVVDLASHFLAENGSPMTFDRDAVALLFQYDWPGNVRELKNTIDRIIAFNDGPVITPKILEKAIYGKCRVTPVDEAMEEIAERLLQLDLGNTFSAIENCLVDYAVKKSGGNKTQAAKLLGVHRKSIERRVQALNDRIETVRDAMKTGKLLMRDNDYETAAGHFEEALDVLRELPMKTENSDLRFEALSKLSICQRNREGWSSENVLDAYDEALKLGKSLGREQELISVTFGLWTTRLMALELGPAKEMASELLAQGEKLNSSQYRIQAHLALANTDFWLGNFSGVFTSLESFYAIYQFHEDLLVDHGMDPYLLCVMFEGLSAFQVGELPRARKALDKGLEHARSIAHPFSLAIALQGACWLEWLFQDRYGCKAYAEELVEVSSTNGFSFYQGLGEVFLGRLLADDDVDAGIEMIKSGYLDKMVHSGGRLFHSFYSLLLAESMLIDNRLNDAQVALEEAIDVAYAKNEMCYLSELICLKGRVHARHGKADLAAAEFNRAAYTALPIQSRFASVNALYELVQISNGSEMGNTAREQLRHGMKAMQGVDDHPRLTEIHDFLSD